jgi:hypothetical protein
MPSHFSSIGFPVQDQDELQALAARAIKSGKHSETASGSYVQWRERNGAEIWVQLDQDGAVIGVNPHFAGRSAIRVGLAREVFRPGGSALDGAFYGWVNPTDEKSRDGEYPLVFDSPDFLVHRPNLPTVLGVQISAFAHKVQVYADEKAYQAAGASLAPEAFIPSGLFTPTMESIEPPNATAVLAGRVVQCSTFTNWITGSKYEWALVHTLGGEVDVVIDPDILQTDIHPGNILAGPFWLSGRLRLPKQKPEAPGNPLRLCRLGERIELDPTIRQPAEVFDFDSYKAFLGQARALHEQKSRIHAAIQTYPQKERSKTQEWSQYDVISNQYRSLVESYLHRLPVQRLAQCPYCETDILQPVDVFSLMGLHGDLSANRVFFDLGGWQKPTPFKQTCPHAVCATVSVNLNGYTPDDLAPWLMGSAIQFIDSSPQVMIWPLIARYTSAVMHALPVGRLDEKELTHRYTMYVAAYFAEEGTNLFTDEMWAPNDLGGPATRGVWRDNDLLKWARAGRLSWMDPGDVTRLVKGPAADFPYGNIEPSWYSILENGQLAGPHPYLHAWQGEAPAHDQSYLVSIEGEK